MTPSHVPSQLRQQVNRIADTYPAPRWTPTRRTEYALALQRFHGKTITRAITEGIAGWTKDMAPPPGYFVEFAIALEEHERREEQTQNGRELPEWNRSLVMEQASAIINRLRNGTT